MTNLITLMILAFLLLVSYVLSITKKTCEVFKSSIYWIVCRSYLRRRFTSGVSVGHQSLTTSLEWIQIVGSAMCIYYKC